jgi:hypothetical protein
VTTGHQYADGNWDPWREQAHLGKRGLETLVFSLKPYQTGIIIEDRTKPGTLATGRKVHGNAAGDGKYNRRR